MQPYQNLVTPHSSVSLPSSTAHSPAKLQASSNLTRRWSNSCGWQWWTTPLVKPTKWRLLLWLLGLQETIMLSIEVPQVNAINSIHTETDATRTAHSMHLAALDFTRPDDPNLCERRREMNDKKKWLKRGLKWYQSVWHEYHEHSGSNLGSQHLPAGFQCLSRQFIAEVFHLGWSLTEITFCLFWSSAIEVLKFLIS